MLKLNKETHTYSDENGKVYPSVTQLIDAAGLKSTYDSGTTYYADLGEAVHKLLELYDKDDLGEYNPAYQPYLDSWIKFKNDYPGLDETLLDIKTGQKYKWHPIQTAGYQVLYEHHQLKGCHIELPLLNNTFAGTIDRIYSSTGKIKKRMAVYISPDGYKVEDHREVNDFLVFNAALILYIFKNTRKKRNK